MSDHTLLVDLPRGVDSREYLSQVAQTAGKPARRLVLTRIQEGDVAIVRSLLEGGITKVLTSKSIRNSLVAAEKISPMVVQAMSATTAIGEATVRIDFIPLDDIVGKGGGAVHLPKHKVLFAGPLVVNGPRTRLSDSDTARWISALEQLGKFKATQIVPGFGSWDGSWLLERQRRFLLELRRQVAYGISMGRPLEAIGQGLLLPASYYTWMPYDNPRPEDIAHVYKELTIPAAPFSGAVPRKSDPRPHALCVIADRYHEPEYIETGLRPVFEATRVIPHFTVDVRALSAENLAHVKLLVILRDGMLWPDGPAKPHSIWMTPEQERAVVEFVEAGGGFLNLHNSMGLYPANGAYLKLVGGRYIGHGPLERFRVEVVDSGHPVTRGVGNFSVADEQHTPPCDKGKVRLLLQNRSDEGKVAAAGWVYEPGRGRLCHLANGHTRESLLHPMYQLLMRNAVNWCLRQETSGTAAHGSRR